MTNKSRLRVVGLDKSNPTNSVKALTGNRAKVILSLFLPHLSNTSYLTPVRQLFAAECLRNKVPQREPCKAPLNSEGRSGMGGVYFLNCRVEPDTPCSMPSGLSSGSGRQGTLPVRGKGTLCLKKLAVLLKASIFKDSKWAERIKNTSAWYPTLLWACHWLKK